MYLWRMRRKQRACWHSCTGISRQGSGCDMLRLPFGFRSARRSFGRGTAAENTGWPRERRHPVTPACDMLVLCSPGLGSHGGMPAVLPEREAGRFCYSLFSCCGARSGVFACLAAWQPQMKKQIDIFRLSEDLQGSVRETKICNLKTILSSEKLDYKAVNKCDHRRWGDSIVLNNYLEIKAFIS